MKKFLVAILCCLMTLSLIACYETQSSEEESVLESIEETLEESESLSEEESGTEEESNSEESDTEEQSDESQSEEQSESEEESESEEHVHALAFVDAIAPTCVEDGNLAHWVCECGATFEDEEGQIVLENVVVLASGHDLYFVEGVEPTCVEDGNLAHWICECGATFEDEEGQTVLENVVVPATDVHDYDENGDCATCDKNVYDKNGILIASDYCTSVVYTEDAGWKLTSEGETTYYVDINHEAVAHAIAQGADRLTITFCAPFDGFEGDSLRCKIWILPEKADGTGNDWGYSVNNMMQTELDKDANGFYYHTIDLTNEAYDFVNSNVTLYVDYKAANTGATVGCIYVKDVELYKEPEAPDPTDKNNWFIANENCASAVYTEDLGWKFTSAGDTTYYVDINHETVAQAIAQGADRLKITFCAPFDGFEGDSLRCKIWILPEKADGTGNDWGYSVNNMMQTELDKDANGFYYHVIDLTNEAYDFVNSNLTLYVDYKAANTGATVGCIYVKDLELYKEPEAPDPTDKNNWFIPSDYCASANYTEGMGWKIVAMGNSNYYVKINPATTAHYIAQGKERVTITFCGVFDGADYGSNNPLNCKVWILPPNASNGGNDWNYPISNMMQTQLDNNGDGTYSHTIDLTNTAYNFLDYGITIYIDYKAANTGGVVGAIYVKDVVYTENVAPALADYIYCADGECTVAYTEGTGWKITSSSSGDSYYNWYIDKDVIAYYVSQGMTTMTITVGGSFDGTSHEGNAVNCQEWLIPKTSAGSDDWGYKNGFFSGWTSVGNGKYSYTIDLTDANYNFVGSDFRIRVSNQDKGTAGGPYEVGATYVYDISFT